jgi:hypothetical protein
MSDSGEHLLYVLSARHELAWSTFKHVFDVLYQARGLDQTEIDQARARRTGTIRSLQSLGHCDFVFGEGGSRALVAPAVLSRLPTGGLPKAILCGARSPQTLSQLQTACADHECVVDLREQATSAGLLPRRICIEAKSASDLEALASALGITLENSPPSWSLANLARPLGEMLDRLKWQQGNELTWARKDFDTQFLQFRLPNSSAIGVQFSRYLNPTNGIYLHWLWRDDTHAEIDCDWGRYAALQECGKNVLFYDERAMDFAAPRGAPLPKLLSRSLCLCSGYGPRRMSDAQSPWRRVALDGYDIYSDVPLKIAELVAEAVGQTLIPHPIAAAFI